MSGAARKIPPETRERLAMALRPFLLRRTKEQVAPELPEKTEQTVLCELEGTQRRLYDELRDHYRGASPRRSRARAGRRARSRSSKRCCGCARRPATRVCSTRAASATRAPSSKRSCRASRRSSRRAQGAGLLPVHEPPGAPAKRLDAKGWTYEYLDGATPDRQARVERFQSDPDCPLFLISLKAGGLGLNLTAAEYVFLLDPWWNPAVEAQAIDRAHRIGQRRPVFAYRLIAKDTVEEKILELQAEKRELADAILGGDERPLASLTRDDFELLLG